MYKMIFILAVAVTGGIEWLKGILPEKVKNNSKIIAAISGVVSAVTGALFVTFASPVLGLEVARTVPNYLIYIGGTIGLVQVAYNVLLQTFKGVVAKLKANAQVDALTADEIADEIESKVKEAVANANK